MRAYRRLQRKEMRLQSSGNAHLTAGTRGDGALEDTLQMMLSDRHGNQQQQRGTADDHEQAASAQPGSVGVGVLHRMHPR